MEEQYSVFVNAGAVVLLSYSLSEQEKQDVLNSVLFAQLVANKKYPEFVLGDGWYETCLGVLKDGWLQQAVAWNSFGIDEPSKCAMVEWVGSQLEHSPDRTTVARVVDVFNDIARLPGNHPLIELLCEQTHRQKTIEVSEGTADAVCDVRLQLIVVRQGAVMSSLFVEFRTATQAISHPLDYLFTFENVLGRINLRWFEANLSSVLYVSLRDAIIKKLSDRAVKNILGFSGDQLTEVPPIAGKPL